MRIWGFYKRFIQIFKFNNLWIEIFNGFHIDPKIQKNFRWGFAPDPKIQVNKTQVTKTQNPKKIDD